MPLPSRLSAYQDVQRILDAVKRAGGGIFIPTSGGSPGLGAARYWITRANKFRNLLRERDAEFRGSRAAMGTSVYDDMTIRRVCGCAAKCHNPDNCHGHKVLIELTYKVQGDLVDLEGKPLPIAPIEPPAQLIDETLAAGLAVAKDLGALSDDD